MYCIGVFMTRIINIFILLIAFFFLNCSASNMNNESFKNEAVKKCPVCPKTNKKKKKCKSKIIYKELAQLVIGEIERAYLPKLGIDLRARIDTGAKTTSIHAENMFHLKEMGKSGLDLK